MEAIPLYSNLAYQLKRDGVQQFAAFCCLAVARCHEAQKTLPLQANELQTAGALFWNISLDEANMDITDFEENTEQAVHCFKIAINIYLSLKKFGLASSLYYEMATGLKYLKRYSEAAIEFRKAAECQQGESALVAINSHVEAFSCSIEYGGYSDAYQDLQMILKLATEEAHESNSSFFKDKKTDALVSSIMISLLQQDIEQAKLMLKLLRREETTRQSQSTDKYPIDLYGTHEWFYCLLTEVIDAFEAGDEESLSSMHAELHETFTPVQNRLYLLLLDASRPVF
jgi:tetratricopeptide (TPR) repeat protein